MVSIKNVAIFGGSGALGTPILKVLIASGKFNITAVSRKESKATFPAGVKVVNVDITSVAELTEALKGQDAVVSAVGTDGFLGQTVVFDAAVAAGVKRFLPSEFGSDLKNPKNAALPVFGYKIAVQKHIEEKIAAGADITYTYVENSGFLDWGIEVNFLLNWSQGKPEIYDGGDQLFSATTLESVGDAVVGVLTHYEETKNRAVYVEDIKISQNQLLAIAKKVAPEKKFEPVPVKIADILQSSYEALGKGDYSFPVMRNFIFASIFGGKEHGQPFSNIENELVGVKGKTESDVEEIFKKVFASQK